VNAAHKYARVERERRFLLDRFPEEEHAARVRRITDRYIEGARLRLRKQTEPGGPTVFKLTQKVPARAAGGRQGFITSMYLSSDEFLVLSQLPASELVKARYSVPPFAIDVFAGPLAGLFLAEAEFGSEDAAKGLALPPFVLHEVTEDDRFTGGRLVRASQSEIHAWLLEYGIGCSRGGLEDVDTTSI
jgi:CYTH domain-containing protein